MKFDIFNQTFFQYISENINKICVILMTLYKCISERPDQADINKRIYGIHRTRLLGLEKKW